ncbi:MAG: helix-turn-helix domain-containing protein [Gammaproteobacteria bacterium]|nr:MAG: helix-turn-helix domain-containing protein [Gammaproteobacteria bacterium]
MDSLITSAALALAKGDFFGALNRVALRDDAPALALRGIAMAQLGDLERAKILLRKASRAFGARQVISQARCVVAEAEIALAVRDLDWSARRLESAQKTLEEHGDNVNAAYAQHLQIRLLLLVGRLSDAEASVDTLNTGYFSPTFRAAHELVIAGIAMRRLRIKAAYEALVRAQEAATLARVHPLLVEIENAFQVLQTPAARLLTPHGDRLLLLSEVEALLTSDVMVVDACRYVVRHQNEAISLSSRPILFSLVRALGEAWPGDVSRDHLVKIAFKHKLADESLRARLRVEIGRLRVELADFADIEATTRGFRLVLHCTDKLVVLDQPIQEKHSAILAILNDGESWSSSALAIVLGTSQRTVQRALDSLAIADKVQSFGRGQARRWVTSPLPGVTTILLLPGPLPGS